MKDYEAFFREYPFAESSDSVLTKAKQAVSDTYDRLNNATTWKEIFRTLEITTLKATDHEESIRRLVEKINELDDQYPEIPVPAGICVYPAWVETAKGLLTEDVEISTVVGFPSSQTFTEVKIAETALAIADGATEIDMVLPVGKFLAGDYDSVYNEIQEVKSACRDHRLKVILETGLLKDPTAIWRASLLAMEAGADFIKTTTGKEIPTDLNAVWIMASAIKAYREKTKQVKGIKIAGGVNETQDAVIYYGIVLDLLGADYLAEDHFRIGTSRLANKLMSSILKEDISYF